jgi:hypothetical protein
MANRPSAVAFDVVETLMPLEPLAARLERAGLPRLVLREWFTRLLLTHRRRSAPARPRSAGRGRAAAPADSPAAAGRWRGRHGTSRSAGVQSPTSHWSRRRACQRRPNVGPASLDVRHTLGLLQPVGTEVGTSTEA